MLDLSLFRNARFTAGARAIALTFFAMFGVIFGLTQYLQFVLGRTALEAGHADDRRWHSGSRSGPGSASRLSSTPGPTGSWPVASSSSLSCS